MTMSAAAKTIPASKFKAQCLALLDSVARTGRSVVVTKRGKPVARLVPLEGVKPPSLLGSVLYEGDIVSPISTEWESNR